MNTPYNSHPPVTDFGLPISGLKFSATLAITTDTALTIPGSAPRYKAVIKVVTTGSVFVALNETAEVPVGAAFASTTSELLPEAREVRKGDVLHFISDVAASNVTVALYALGVTT